MLDVAVFDDVVHARGETFHIPGLAVDVFAHADDAVALCTERPYAVVFMDYAMGAQHVSGAAAVRALRAAGFKGRIVATSSDPAANEEMIRAGADESLPRKAHLRPYLLHMGAAHLQSIARAQRPDDTPDDHDPS